MGFLTRLLAGLVAASTLGAGLTGTANAVDTNGAAGTTKSVVKLTADDTNNLPDHIVNGSFDYPSVPSWTGLAGSGSNKFNKGKRFATINPGTGKYGSGCAMSTTGRAIPNWNRSSFAWSSTQGDTHYSGGMSCEAGNVELNYDSVHHNQFAELTADQQGTAIYQDVKVTPGTMMKWSLKHSSATSAYVDKMQVMIGEPYKETAQEATRITSENGNKVGEKMTTISTPTTSDRADNKKWDTYSGAYLVPDGVTTVRFTFKSVASAEWYSGNDLDDIEFSRSYKLTYDKNSSDAAGEVPSNQRGRENTVQPAKSKTTGTVKTVVDTSDGLPTELVNGDFEYPGADVLSQNLRDKKRNWWGVSRKDKMVYESDNPTKWVSLPSTFDSDRFAWDSSEAGKTSGVQEGSSQWHTNEVELQRDSRTGNMYAELSPYQAQSSIRQCIRTTPGALYKVRLKHASLSSEYLDKMQVLIGADGNERPVRMTRVESQNGLDATGKATASTTISTHASNKAEISWGSGLGYHSSRNHDGQWATYEGVYVATSDVTVFTFKSVDSPSFNTGNLLDDVMFTKAYKLTYDKNSVDASGQVPSNQRGKENTTQPAKTKTSGTVKTVADTNASLPDHLVNGDFSVNYHDQWKDSFGGWTSIDPNAGKTLHATNYVDSSGTWKWTAINGWDRSKFGWTSTQKAGSNVQQKANAVELQYDDSTADNVYAELCAHEAGTAIYQDIRTTPGTLYKVRLKHASLNQNYLDKMQVMIGAPGHEQPVEMTRTSVNGHGDKLNEKSTTIATKVTNGNNRHHADQWETYEGTYLIPDGQTTTRFTFKSIDSKQLDYGNVLDDIVFDKAYRLDYDKNASDATGEVPSNQRGRENTVKQTKATGKSKTSGTVETVDDEDQTVDQEDAASSGTESDTDAGADTGRQEAEAQSSTGQGKAADTTSLPDHIVNGSFSYPACPDGKDSCDVDPTTGWGGFYVDYGRKFMPIPNWDRSKFGWDSSQEGLRPDQQPTSHQKLQHCVQIGNMANNNGKKMNRYAEIIAETPDEYLYQDIATTPGVMYKWSLKHASEDTSHVDSMQVMIGSPGKETVQQATRTTSNGRGDKTGVTSKTIATKGAQAEWETYTGVYIATSTVTRFTFKSAQGRDSTRGNFIDDVMFTKAYKLTYDKNSADASGQVPSNQRGKENTVQPAKAKTAGTVRTVTDKTDGKVSDLVQRTTTHEDGSVTVRTIDTSTDVVSGCQVYYPAGQRITLATLAKDDDCWDSSMLSRLGHTQLGWNQDSQATQAQAEVTMVEGGMTVYAVWVGNPVLTYDTNKPSTWGGQMPSTPASVSVPYNTAAADGSGWQAGDTSKIRGYKFLGWYTAPQDNTGLYQWATPLTGNVTVYAHWQRLQANVIYNANGGTGSHPNTTGWQYSDVTIPGDTSKSFKHDGLYLFKHWNTQPNDQGTVYTDGSRIALQDKDITLYAIWVPYHENFVPTGGIGLPIAIAGGVLLLMFGIGSTVMLTRRMNGHGMPDDE